MKKFQIGFVWDEGPSNCAQKLDTAMFAAPEEGLKNYGEIELSKICEPLMFSEERASGEQKLLSSDIHYISSNKTISLEKLSSENFSNFKIMKNLDYNTKQ